MDETPFQSIPLDAEYERRPGGLIRWVIQVIADCDVSVASSFRRPAWGPGAASTRELPPRLNLGCSHADLFLDVVREDGRPFLRQSGGVELPETDLTSVVGQPHGLVQTPGSGLIVVYIDIMSLPPASWACGSKLRLTTVMDTQLLIASTPFALKDADPPAPAPPPVIRSSFSSQLHHAVVGILALRSKMRSRGVKFAIKLPGSGDKPALGAAFDYSNSNGAGGTSDPAASEPTAQNAPPRPNYSQIMPDAFPPGMIEGSDVALGMLSWSEAAFKLQKAQIDAEASSLEAVFAAATTGASEQPRLPLFSPHDIVAALNDRRLSIVTGSSPPTPSASAQTANQGGPSAGMASASSSITQAPVSPAVAKLEPLESYPPPIVPISSQSGSGWDVLLERDNGEARKAVSASSAEPVHASVVQPSASSGSLAVPASAPPPALVPSFAEPGSVVSAPEHHDTATSVPPPAAHASPPVSVEPSAAAEPSAYDFMSSSSYAAMADAAAMAEPVSGAEAPGNDTTATSVPPPAAHASPPVSVEPSAAAEAMGLDTMPISVSLAMPPPAAPVPDPQPRSAALPESVPTSSAAATASASAAEYSARYSPGTEDRSSTRDNASQMEDSDFEAEVDAPSSPDSLDFWESMSSRRYVETIVHVLFLALGFEQFETGDLSRDLCTVYSHIKPTSQARTGARAVGPSIVWPERPPTPILPAAPASEDLTPGQGDSVPHAADVDGPSDPPSLVPDAAALPSAPAQPPASSSPGAQAMPATAPGAAAPPSLAPGAPAATVATAEPGSSSSSSFPAAPEASVPTAHAAAPPSDAGTASSSSSEAPPVRIRIRSVEKHRIEAHGARRLRTRLMSGLIDLSDASVMTHKSGAAKRRRSALRALMASVLAAALRARIVDSSIFQIPTVRRMATRAKKRPASSSKRAKSPELDAKRQRPSTPPHDEPAHDFRGDIYSGTSSAADIHGDMPVPPFTARQPLPFAAIGGHDPRGMLPPRGMQPHDTEQALATTLSGRAWRAGLGGGMDAVPQAPRALQGSGLSNIPSADFSHMGTAWAGDGSVMSRGSLGSMTGFSTPGGYPSGVGMGPSEDSLTRRMLAAMTQSQVQQQDMLWGGDLSSAGPAGGFGDMGPRGPPPLSSQTPLRSDLDSVPGGFQGMSPEVLHSIMARYRSMGPASSAPMDAAVSRHLGRGMHMDPGHIELQVRGHGAHRAPPSSGLDFPSSRGAYPPTAGHPSGAGMPPGAWHHDPREAAAHAAAAARLAAARAAAARAAAAMRGDTSDLQHLARYGSASIGRSAAHASYEDWVSRQRSMQAHAQHRQPPSTGNMYDEWAAGERAGFGHGPTGMPPMPFAGPDSRGQHGYMGAPPGRFPGSHRR